MCVMAWDMLLDNAQAKFWQPANKDKKKQPYFNWLFNPFYGFFLHIYG